MSREHSSEWLRGAIFTADLFGFDALADVYREDLSAAEAVDRNHRTRDGKLCCVEVTRSDTHPGTSCVCKFNDFDLAAEMDDSEVGDRITLKYVELTDEEFDDLGDFDGW